MFASARSANGPCNSTRCFFFAIFPKNTQDQPHRCASQSWLRFGQIWTCAYRAGHRRERKNRVLAGQAGLSKHQGQKRHHSSLKLRQMGINKAGHIGKATFGEVKAARIFSFMVAPRLIASGSRSIARTVQWPFQMARL